MKYALAFALVLSAPLAHAAPVEYRCHCNEDADVECEGNENLLVSLDRDKAEIELGSLDWEMNDGFETKANPNYRPRSSDNADYAQYVITAGGGGYSMNTRKSNFLIEKAMLKGKKYGRVKLHWVGEGPKASFATYIFDCMKD